MVLYQAFGTIEAGPARKAVLAPDRTVLVALGSRRIEVVVRAAVTALVSTDDWFVDDGPFPTDDVIVTTALVLDVQQRTGAGAGEQAWEAYEPTLPVLLMPSLQGDVVTWRGEIELASRRGAGDGPARRLRISEIDWYDGPVDTPAAGDPTTPFVRHIVID